MNRFAHKHIGQLTLCAAWPKHEQQSRKHARRKKLNRDGNRLQKLFISLLFYVFLVLTVHPSLSPASLFHSHSFPLAHSTPFCISLTPPPPHPAPTPHYTSPLLKQLSFPLSFFLFLFLSLRLIPALPSLPDIVARCPMSHTSAKIIRDGEREEGAKERNRQGERKSRRV